MFQNWFKMAYNSFKIIYISKFLSNFFTNTSKLLTLFQNCFQNLSQLFNSRICKLFWGHTCRGQTRPDQTWEGWPLIWLWPNSKYWEAENLVFPHTILILRFFPPPPHPPRVAHTHTERERGGDERGRERERERGGKRGRERERERGGEVRWNTLISALPCLHSYS